MNCIIHQDEEILGICFHNECKVKSRLACFICTISDHASHSENILDLCDLYNFNSKSHQTIWPKDDKGKEIRWLIINVHFLERQFDHLKHLKMLSKCHLFLKTLKIKFALFLKSKKNQSQKNTMLNSRLGNQQD